MGWWRSLVRIQSLRILKRGDRPAGSGIAPNLFLLVVSEIFCLNPRYIITMSSIIALKRKATQANRMFTAYQPILSERGQRAATVVSALVYSVGRDQIVDEQINQAEGVFELWPTLENAGPLKWLSWFKPDLAGATIGDDEAAVGIGCKLPCQHCAVGNGVFEAKNEPLPVVMQRILRTKSPVGNRESIVLTRPERTDNLDWLDPFFGVRFDYFVAFLLSKNWKKVLALMSKGCEIDDLPAQVASENISRLLADYLSREYRFDLSFVLALPNREYNLISAVYNGREKDLIEAYAQRYANNIKLFGANIITGLNVFCYDPMRITEGFPSDMTPGVLAEYLPPSFDRLVMQALQATLDKLEPNERFFLWSKTRFHRILDDGRGFDFKKRLQLVQNKDSRCLQPDKTLYRDREIPLASYPVNAISRRGRVRVYQLGEVSYQTSLTELESI